MCQVLHCQAIHNTKIQRPIHNLFSISCCKLAGGVTMLWQIAHKKIKPRPVYSYASWVISTLLGSKLRTTNHNYKTTPQSSRKRLIGRIFTQTFAVLRQINPDMDSPLRLFLLSLQ